MATKIISKRCTKCKKIKSFDEFNKNKYKRNGLSCACKQCLNKQHRDWYNNKGGAKKKYQYEQTEKYKIGHRKAYQKWYKTKGKKWQRQYDLKYKKTEKGKIVCTQKSRKWRKTKGKEYYRNCYKENPNQFKAYDTIQKAIKCGDILSPKLLKCTYCGKKAALYHHASYEPEQWLIVIPLCGLCHKKIHRELSLSG